ncbi:hypothetical protein EYC80_003931 [Monilinia laxa]|uniref:Uncharacterized protein n=1 Tax=Monilinia laxa TaxID=61186 RepID=A0A5N6KLN2_MONLA|nr:hypothetical protein EYC80_003931 [Monilinia laxa]
MSIHTPHLCSDNGHLSHTPVVGSPFPLSSSSVSLTLLDMTIITDQPISSTSLLQTPTRALYEGTGTHDVETFQTNLKDFEWQGIVPKNGAAGTKQSA